MQESQSKAKVYIVATLVTVVVVGTFLISKPPEPIYLGFIAGLSGRDSQLGVNGRNAVILKVDEINRNGGINGRPIELLIRDHGGDKELCHTVAKELAPKVTAIIGPYLSSMADAVLSATEPQQCLVISPTVSSDRYLNKDDFLIRLTVTASQQGAALAKAVQHRRGKRAAFIFDSRNAAFTTSVLAGFEKEFTGNQGRLKAYPIATTADIAETINQVAAWNPDSIVYCLSTLDSAACFQELYKKNVTVKQYGSAWSRTGPIARYGGRGVEGAIFIGTTRDDNFSQKERLFARNYELMYNTPFRQLIKHSYEAISVFERGARKLETINSKTLKKSLLALPRLNGVAFSKFGDAEREIFFEIVREGRLTPYKIENSDPKIDE